MRAELIAVGTELTLGTTVDTNSAWIARTLAQVGVKVERITLVDDQRERIAEAVRSAWEAAELVICTGGLGPTADDLTREAVAEAFGMQLVLNEELLAAIEARFRSFGRTMSASNRQQAMIPDGARPIANARGTAPIFLIDQAGKALMVLPGVPSEMRFLVETELLPFLRNERGLRSVLIVRSVYLTGTSEAEAGEAIADLMEAPYPIVGISAKAAKYEVRVAAQGDDPAQVEADVAATVAEVRRRLAAFVVEGGTLEERVVSLLKQRQETLALHEGLSTAPVYMSLRTQPAGLAALRGVTIHVLDRAVDVNAAESLARGAAHDVRDGWQATYGLAVQPAAPSADGWTEVCILLTTPTEDRLVTRRVDLRAEDAVGFIATAALDLLRRTMEKRQ